MMFRKINGSTLEDHCHDSSSFYFESSCQCNSTYILQCWEKSAVHLATVGMRRQQRRLQIWTILFMRQYLLPFMLKEGNGRWCDRRLCRWEGHMTWQYLLGIIRTMQQYLHSIMLSGVSKTLYHWLHMTLAMRGTSCFKLSCWCNGTYILWYWKEATDVTGFVRETVMPRHSPFQPILSFAIVLTVFDVAYDRRLCVTRRWQIKHCFKTSCHFNNTYSLLCWDNKGPGKHMTGDCTWDDHATPWNSPFQSILSFQHYLHPLMLRWCSGQANMRQAVCLMDFKTLRWCIRTYTLWRERANGRVSDKTFRGQSPFRNLWIHEAAITYNLWCWDDVRRKHCKTNHISLRLIKRTYKLSCWDNVVIQYVRCP
jgi:hypothetical protein